MDLPNQDLIAERIKVVLSGVGLVKLAGDISVVAQVLREG